MKEKYKDERDKLNSLPDKELDKIFEKEYEYILKNMEVKNFGNFIKKEKITKDST